MFTIVRKEELNPQVKLMEVKAPLIAKKAQTGQFIILRVDEQGERIPLTIAEADTQQGTITIIFQEVGKTTRKLGACKKGDALLDFVGPLGMPTEYPQSLKKAAVIGGGLGTAIAYPQIRELAQKGVETHAILGFRSKELVILEDMIRAQTSHVWIATDDGSYGIHGFTTDVLKQKIEQGHQFDLVIAIGPLVMMKYIAQLTKQFGIKTIVSMNPIMVDGTGMCGGCRVTVGGQTKFACVDGPDFDGHQVDFDEAIRRSMMYQDMEKQSNHACKLEDM